MNKCDTMITAWSSAAYLPTSDRDYIASELAVMQLKQFWDNTVYVPNIRYNCYCAYVGMALWSGIYK